MKKHISGYKLNRDSSSRLSLMRGLVASLIAKEEIITTNAKASAVTPIFEKLVTRAKTDSLAARRIVQAYVQNNALVKRLFTDVAPRYRDVHGGYTKLIVVGNRRGDNAAIVRLSLTQKSPVAEKGKHVITPEPAKETKKPTVKTITPEKVSATHAAPKLVKRTGKRGDK